MRRAVGSHEAIAEEIAVAGHIHAEVASVGPERPSLGVKLQQTLVYPVPYISALQIGIGIDSLPLCGEITV